MKVSAERQDALICGMLCVPAAKRGGHPVAFKEGNKRWDLVVSTKDIDELDDHGRTDGELRSSAAAAA